MEIEDEYFSPLIKSWLCPDKTTENVVVDFQTQEQVGFFYLFKLLIYINRK